MTTTHGESTYREPLLDRFDQDRRARRDFGSTKPGRAGFVGADHLVALASSGRSIRLFTAPGDLEDFAPD